MQGTNKQVTHFYVVKANDSVGLASMSDGTFKIKSNNFTTDLIDPSTVSIKATKAAALKPKLRNVTITVDSTRTFKAGEEVFVNLKVPQYVGVSDYETLERQGNYVVKTNDTAATIAAGIATSLTKNMKSLFEQVVSVSVGTSSDTNVITIKSAEPQGWKRGVNSDVYAYFTVTSDNIDYSSTATVGSTNGYSTYVYDWCTIQECTPVEGTLGNGHNIADLEYFCLGNRGDIYRGVGFPVTIDTEYNVDPSKEYDVIDISYAFIGDGENALKTNKNIVLVAEKLSNTGSSGSAYMNNLSTLLSALNTACGTSASFGNN